jgi:hypothetical protein
MREKRTVRKEGSTGIKACNESKVIAIFEKRCFLLHENISQHGTVYDTDDGDTKFLLNAGVKTEYRIQEF